MGKGKRPARIDATLAVSVVPPAPRGAFARARPRPSEQATISVPAVRESQLSTIAVPAVPVVLDEAKGATARRTVLAMTQRAAVVTDVVEEIPIDLGDLEDHPDYVTEAYGRVHTQPYRVAIGAHVLEPRPSLRLWILTATVAGLAMLATLLVVA